METAEKNKLRAFVYGGGKIDEKKPIRLKDYIHPVEINGEVGYPVCSVPKAVSVSKTIGKTVYDVTVDFDAEGKQSLFQQFKTLILNASQN